MSVTSSDVLMFAFTSMFLFGTGLTIYMRLAWGRPVRWLSRRRHHRHA